LESQQRETTLSFGLPAEYYSEDLSLWLVLETAQDTSTIRASQPILITGIGHG
jgi:hypothetical protein